VRVTGQPELIQVGVDVGGTKIESAALDARGDFLARIRRTTPNNYDAAIRLVCELVSAAEQQAGAQRARVGIGIPGSISPHTGRVHNANTQWLNGRRFHEDMSQALGRDVRIANDANCLALSEVRDGAAAGSTTTFAAVLGTGCGGGLMFRGRLVEGANGIGGEWGHVPLPWLSAEELVAPRCWCGQSGCLENWISGSGLQRDYARATNLQRTAEEIVEEARNGAAEASHALGRYISRLGRALAMICNVVDPDTIVLGGGLSNVSELYEGLPRVVRAHVFAQTWSARIVAARWGDSSGVRGAARLWSDA
jgi:fructokinase